MFFGGGAISSEPQETTPCQKRRWRGREGAAWGSVGKRQKKLLNICPDNIICSANVSQRDGCWTPYNGQNLHHSGSPKFIQNLPYNNYRLYQQIIWVPMMCPVFINPSCVCALFCLFHKHKKYNTHFNFCNILSLCLVHIRKKTQSNMQSMVNSKARVSEVLSARSTSHFYSFIITQYNPNVAKGVRDPCLECFLSKVSF